MPSAWVESASRRHTDRLHGLPSITKDVVESTQALVPSQPLQAIVACMSAVGRPMLSSEPAEEGELLSYWNSIHRSRETRVITYANDEPKWTLTYAPQAYARDEGVKGVILSIAASEVIHRTASPSIYQSCISQYGHYKAIEQVRNGVETFTALTSKDTVSISFLEQLLLSSFLLGIRLQLLSADVAVSSASSSK